VSEIQTSRHLALRPGAGLDGTRLVGSGGAAVRFVADASGLAASLAGVSTNMDLDAGIAGFSINVSQGLTLDGATVRLGNRSGSAISTLMFYGTQTLGGTGTVIFGGVATSEFVGGAPNTIIHYPHSPNDVFTIGAGVTIRGSAGRIEGHNPYSDPAWTNSIVNLGTIVADASPPSVSDAPYVRRDGFSSGISISANPIDTSAVSNPLAQGVYQTVTQHYSNEVSVGLDGLTAGSTYRVRLHFAETQYDATSTATACCKTSTWPPQREAGTGRSSRSSTSLPTPRGRSRPCSAGGIPAGAGPSSMRSRCFQARRRCNISTPASPMSARSS
jgi:hypothetical protein